jgi:AraC-like DNA-binding protein
VTVQSLDARGFRCGALRMSQKFTVSTDSLPGANDAQRFETWNGLTNWGMSFQRSEAPLHVSVEARSLDNVEVVRTDATLAQSIRSRRHIATDSDDRFAIAFPLSDGLALARQCDRELETGARGEACLVSFTEPVDLSIQAPAMRWMRLLLPARPLVSRAPGVEDLVARPLGAAGETLRLLFRYAAFTLDNDALIGAAAEQLAATHCLDLAVLALGAGRDEAELARNRGVRAARLGEVLRHIRSRYADPGLSVETIARELGVTDRYVHRLLAESGRTFGERVLELRLEAGRSLLMHNPAKRVSEVAFEVGFSDLSYFNRCFRRRYGVTPTAARGG